MPTEHHLHLVYNFKQGSLDSPCLWGTREIKVRRCVQVMTLPAEPPFPTFKILSRQVTQKPL